MEPNRKYSKKREAIFSCICSTDTHPSAEWVYNQLKPQIPDLSLATVYRNLALFKREGRIVSVGVVQNLERFDANTAPHAHFICTRCGCVMDLPKLQLPSELSQAAAQAVAGEVSGCSLLFEGLCHTCTQNRIPVHSAEKRRIKYTIYQFRRKQYEKVCLPRLRLCLRR